MYKEIAFFVVILITSLKFLFVESSNDVSWIRRPGSITTYKPKLSVFLVPLKTNDVCFSLKGKAACACGKNFKGKRYEDIDIDLHMIVIVGFYSVMSISLHLNSRRCFFLCIPLLDTPPIPYTKTLN